LDTAASLMGVGAVIAEFSTAQVISPVGVLQARFPYALDKSDYQNAAEFAGIVYGMLALVSCGVRDCGVLLRGDSITALAWAQTQRFRGRKGNENAYLIFVLICLKFNLSIADTEFIVSEQNATPDDLSRFQPIRDPNSVAVDPHNYFDLGYFNSTLLQRLDPTTNELVEFGAFLDLWRHSEEALESLGAPANRQVFPLRR